MTKTDYDVIIIGAAFLRQALSFQSANARLTATKLSPASSAKPALL